MDEPPDMSQSVGTAEISKTLQCDSDYGLSEWMNHLRQLRDDCVERIADDTNIQRDVARATGISDPVIIKETIRQVVLSIDNPNET